MGLITVFVFSIGIVSVYSTSCNSVSGNWQNELGSRMMLLVGDSNKLSGEYYTAVETAPGGAALVSTITGLYSNQRDGSLLAFSVLFNHGSSIASWVGQCMVCDGKEVLYTTYTLRKYAADHKNKWATIIVNQNTFRRIENSTENEIHDFSASRIKFDRPLSVVSQKSSGGLELTGKWKSAADEEIDIFGVTENVLGETEIKGKHHSKDLIGQKDGNEMFTAVAWLSTSGERIRSWTGHIYDTISSDVKTLEASWLEHEFHPSCASARNVVRFGTQNFTRAASAEFQNIVNKPETFLDKIRKFFSSMRIG